MKLSPWYLVAVAPIAIAGCSGAFLGQCAVLAVTLCIFVGTLTLGPARRGAASTASVEAPEIQADIRKAVSAETD